jgi:TolB-like protein/class 3 adenylate cyclase/Tfp pilus assembly protein PilF
LSEERVERRLAAVLAADVAGYSRLMGIDEEGTLARLKAIRKSLVDPTIAAHRGRIVKTTGDGMLVEFASAVDAARSAIEVQRGMSSQNADVQHDTRIELRIGIHVGDIIIDDNDIFGDGVNIAARLEGIADPGGICMSDDAYRQVRGKVESACDDLGLQTLKNIAEPMRAWRVQLGGGAAKARPVSPAGQAPVLALPDKPSIAVLPFQNMSGDPEQEYFADGMVEDIITALSHFRNLFVIARNSSFTYKGRSVDVKQVGRELGVRYVLEGSVRKAAGKVRITGQLIDAASGAHLWADRFDGSIDDIFELQDQVTSSVVNAIAPKLEQAEIERVKRKPTENLDAYDHFLRGMSVLNQWTRESNREATESFCKAIELDPNFASAYGMAAWCYVWRKANGWMNDRDVEIGEATRLAKRAVELGRDDAVALSRAGHVIAYVVGDLDSATPAIERALLLNPNLASAWNFAGWTRVLRGEPEAAIEYLARSMRLSPLDQLGYSAKGSTAHAHFFLGADEDASAWADKAVQENPNYLIVNCIAAASHALAGHQEKAVQAVSRMLQIDPSLHISKIKELFPLRRPNDLAKYEEGLRKAGLPD